MKHYRGGDLRKGRYPETGRPYIVTTVTRNRLPVFQDFHVGRLLVASIKDTATRHLAETLAWVIMPDHLHWLLVPGTDPLDAIVRRVKSCSARIVNQQIDSSVPLWQKGYHDHALRKEEDLRAVVRYIVANPVRAGLVRKVGDYPLWDCKYL